MALLVTVKVVVDSETYILKLVIDLFTVWFEGNSLVDVHTQGMVYLDDMVHAVCIPYGIYSTLLDNSCV